MKKYVILSTWLMSALLALSTHTNAQAESEKVWFAIKDGLENQALATTIENNTTAFLHACNETVRTGKKPDFPTAVFTKNAKQEVTDFLTTSPLVTGKMYISEKCVLKSSR